MLLCSIRLASPLPHLAMQLIETWLCTQNPESSDNITAAIFTQNSYCVPVSTAVSMPSSVQKQNQNLRICGGWWPLLEIATRHGSLNARKTKIPLWKPLNTRLEYNGSRWPTARHFHTERVENCQKVPGLLTSWPNRGRGKHCCKP